MVRITPVYHHWSNIPEWNALIEPVTHPQGVPVVRLPCVVECVVDILSRRLALPASLEPEAAAHAAHSVAAAWPLAWLGACAAVLGGPTLEEHGAWLSHGLEGERVRVARQQFLTGMVEVGLGVRARVRIRLGVGARLRVRLGEVRGLGFGFGVRGWG